MMDIISPFRPVMLKELVTCSVAKGTYDHGINEDDDEDNDLVMDIIV